MSEVVKTVAGNRVVIVANGPLPISAERVVEGGGLRCWALYTGLLAAGFDVKIAVEEGYFEEDESSISFSSTGELINLCNDFDAVIYSTSSGQRALEVFLGLNQNILRIGDAYVPIHIEVAARESSNLGAELVAFERDSKVWLDTLRHCDALLLASQNQYLYYLGLLVGQNRVSPSNYKNLPLLQVLHGAAMRQGGLYTPPSVTPTLLWWGGFYPWFGWRELEALIESLQDIRPEIKIRIAGAVNPFVRHPDFALGVDEALERFKLMPNVEVMGWVPYGQRGEVFRNVDMVLALNKISPETSLSWRTRLSDTLEFGVPLATNGSDPFGELIIRRGGGVLLSGAPAAMALQISDSLTPHGIEDMKTNISKLGMELSWSEAVKPLVAFLGSGEKNSLRETVKPEEGRIAYLRKLAFLATPILSNSFRYMRKHGFGATIKRAGQYLGRFKP